MKRAVRLGITGKIGSGKSTFSDLLREGGIEVFDTDTIAKDLMQSNAKLRTRIIELLGERAYGEQGLDRRFVAEAIFGNELKRTALEAVVHPAVSEELERQFAAHAPGTIVGAESALILQSNLVAMFDLIILIDAADEVAVARLTQSGKLSGTDARKRLEDQDYSRIRKDSVDITIQNDGTLEEFARHAGAVIDLIKLLAAREMPAVPLHSIAEESEFYEDVDDAGPIS